MAERPLPPPDPEPFKTIAWRRWAPEDAERTRAAYLLHMLDEFIHHGAAIALLRDLRRWQSTNVPDDPQFEATPHQWAGFLHRDGVVDFSGAIDLRRNGLA